MQLAKIKRALQQKTQQTPRHRTTLSLGDAFVQNNKLSNALLLGKKRQNKFGLQRIHQSSDKI